MTPQEILHICREAVLPGRKGKLQPMCGKPLD